MSRTYRQPPHWANAQLIDILGDLPRDTSKSAIKWLNASMRRCRGQDGTCVTPAHDPSNDSPKGYGWWGSDGMNGKRFSKRRTARIMRRRGSKEIQAQLHEAWNDHLKDEWELMQDELPDFEQSNEYPWFDDDDDLGDHFDEPWSDPYEDTYSCYDEDAYDLSYSQREYDRGILRDMLRRRSAESIINLVHDIETEKELRYTYLNEPTSDEGQTLGDILQDAIERRNTWNKPSWRYGHGELHVHGTVTGRITPADKMDGFWSA